jgi:eukaryotic-like serine/threonine-protein kinase
LPLGGGAPREIAREVAYADWGPDGTQLALATISNHGARIEYPVGHVLYEQKAGWIAHPRVSRDGKLIAFECLPEMETDSGSVCVVDMSGTKKELSKGWISLEGLAWSADGKEICVAGTRGGASGWADKVYGITLSGKEREILALPQMRLHDISKDGKLLVSKESWGRQLIGMFPGDSAEHPYSWLDDGSPTGISDDGKVFSFIENGEVWALTGEAQGYYRKTDGTGAVHMGSGATAVSPDGKHLILFSQAAKKLVVQPVGAGESVELVTPGLQAFAGVAWSGDGSTIVYEASTEDKGWSTYVQRIDGGQPRLVKKTGRES